MAMIHDPYSFTRESIFTATYLRVCVAGNRLEVYILHEGGQRRDEVVLQQYSLGGN